MLTVETEQLARWRSELADYPGVMRSLSEIEDCDGDVEDAAINLALHAGLTPENSEQWLLSYTKRYRVVICQWIGQGQSLSSGQAADQQQPVEVTDIVRHLSGHSSCPELLALPVAVTAWQQGLDAFCEPLKFKIEERL